MPRLKIQIISSLTTDYLMPGVRHTKHMSKTLIPNSYSGYLFRLKHPLRKDMAWLVCAFHEFGIYKVKNINVKMSRNLYMIN